MGSKLCLGQDFGGIFNCSRQRRVTSGRFSQQQQQHNNLCPCSKHTLHCSNCMSFLHIYCVTFVQCTQHTLPWVCVQRMKIYVSVRRFIQGSRIGAMGWGAHRCWSIWPKPEPTSNTQYCLSGLCYCLSGSRLWWFSERKRVCIVQYCSAVWHCVASIVVSDVVFHRVTGHKVCLSAGSRSHPAIVAIQVTPASIAI